MYLLTKATCSSSTSQEPSSSHQESWTVERGEFCEQVQTISSAILLTMTSQSATSASPHINEEADKSNDPPACPKCQEYFDTVVEKTVNEFAEEASCEINKEELNKGELWTNLVMKQVLKLTEKN